MAFASIDKMTVPLRDGDTQGLLMPKLSYRFRILFENFGVSRPTTELTKQVVSFTRPKVGFGEIPIEVYNSRIYLAAKPTWEAVNVTLRDDVSGEVARRVGEQIQRQFDFSEQASAAAGESYKFKMVCNILDGGNGTARPAVLESWEMYGCYISNADYGELNYGNNDPVTIALTIRFDNAVQTPTDDGPDFGVGAAIGRRLGTNISGIGS